jgi:hypothetical protein
VREDCEKRGQERGVRITASVNLMSRGPKHLNLNHLVHQVQDPEINGLLQVKPQPSCSSGTVIALRCITYRTYILLVPS